MNAGANRAFSLTAIAGPGLLCACLLAHAQEPPAGPTEAEAAAPANWLETRIAIEELSEAGDFAAALELGDRLLELAAREFGPDSTGVADAHLLLARVHRRDENFAAAEAEVLTAIDLYESNEGPLAPALMGPFVDLGDTYSEAGNHSGAISAYGEARNIGRRNFGLLNPEQLPLIDEMTDEAEELGELEEARALQLEALALVERNHEEFAPETIEARYKYAAWLREQRLFDEERRIYFQIERIVREHYADEPLMLVRALRERSASYREADSGEGLGLSALREALDVLGRMENPPLRLLARVHLEMGDWFVEFSRTGAVGDDYIEAWNLLGRLDDGAELRREWFEELHAVEISSLSRRGLSTEPSDPEGHVVVYFTVDTSGRTRDIEVTSAEPRDFKESAVMRLMRDARFRPRVVDGQLVRTRRAYRFEYRYEAAAAD